MTSAVENTFEKGCAALRAGDITSALRWLEQAFALANGDPAIALMLAGARLRGGKEGAAELFQALARTHDLNEAWIGLAAASQLQGRPEDAVSAISHSLSRHALQPAPDMAMLANLSRSAGAPGWCGVGSDGQLVIWLVTKPRAAVRLAVSLDGKALELPARGGTREPLRLQLPKALLQARRLSVTEDGKHLLGSPIQIAEIIRVEGFVEVESGGLSGWAWYPNNPSHHVELSIDALQGKTRPLIVTADDETITIAHPRALARPRGFRVTAAALSRFNGTVLVRGPDGRHLYGSPLDASAAGRSAASAVAAVARLHPAGPQNRRVISPPLVELPSIPARVSVPATEGSSRPRPVDVVVPVYRGRDETLACLDSVFASTNRWSRVVVVNDRSPDVGLMKELQRLAARGRIHLLHHPENRGFPSAANTGIRFGPNRDVTLLNSDTLVPKNWLERLRQIAYSAPDIGTVTPLSNDATIVSYPSTEHVNPVPDLIKTRYLDELAQKANSHVTVDIPTGIGFCMYIRRECLDMVGALREDVFAQGYGEENDFCLRARHVGWRHVAAPGVFVGHVGGQSFGAAKAYLIERNLKILNTLHPGYSELIQEFQRADPMADSRRRIDMARWRQTSALAGSVLLITHGRSGGVQTHVSARAAELRAKGLRPIVIWPVANRTSGHDCVLGDGPEGGTPNLRFKVPDELDVLAEFLKPDRPVRAEIHHLVGHDHRILELMPRLGISYDVVVHDYAAFCPRISLVTGTRRYCGEPDVAGCEACIADNGTNTDEDLSVREVLARSERELDSAERVVVPSSDVSARMQRHFPRLHPQIVPWEPELAKAEPIARPRGLPVRVCLVGAIGIEKGYDILLGCARDAAARTLNLEFVLVGFSMDDCRLLDTGRVRITGRYEEPAAASLIREQDADIGFISSVWPETWSYTLTQLWEGGLKVTAFDFGTPAERIRRADRGWLIPVGLGFSAINQALLRFAGTTRSPRGAAAQVELAT
jgi:GT2 family glycosyltransferase/glycosyltransferase involved in cell wall biosynthesis